MAGRKIRIDGSLYDKLCKAADAGGYSSAEEFAIHVLEQAVGELDESLSEEEVKRRLQGLGYVE